MNRDPVATLTVSAPLARAARAVACGAALALLAALTACGGRGAPVTVNAAPPTSGVQTYTGPPAANADLHAFMLHFRAHVSASNPCVCFPPSRGPCPAFAHPARTD